jgi:hypothetical protein
VLAQLGNRVQHALRAFTPRDQKAVKSAADTMRPNPKLDIGAAITELGVGEALVSFLDEKGRPTITERVFIVPPVSQIGPLTADERKTLIASSIVAGVYEKTLDRESAYEILKGRTDEKLGDAAKPAPSNAAAPDTAKSQAGSATPSTAPGVAQNAPPEEPGFFDKIGGLFGGGAGGNSGTAASPRGALRKDSIVEAMAKSAARAVGSQVGREIIRGVLGSILGGKRR